MWWHALYLMRTTALASSETDLPADIAAGVGDHGFPALADNAAKTILTGGDTLADSSGNAFSYGRH